MSLIQGIVHGKEHRKPWQGRSSSKNVDSSCRNHGDCLWCRRNRMHKFRDKHPADTTDILEVAQC